jgi:hypothetical protein
MTFDEWLQTDAGSAPYPTEEALLRAAWDASRGECEAQLAEVKDKLGEAEKQNGLLRMFYVTHGDVVGGTLVDVEHAIDKLKATARAEALEEAAWEITKRDHTSVGWHHAEAIRALKTGEKTSVDM